MNTQNFELHALSDAELDAAAGGEIISQAIGVAVGIAQAIAGAISYEANYLQYAYYYSQFSKGK